MQLNSKKILRHKRIENALRKVLKDGYRTEDIFSDGANLVGCDEMCNKVIERLEI